MRLPTLLYIVHYTICSDFRETKDMRQGRNLFDFLALINSLRFSPNIGFQYTPFILPTPIIILPPSNIQQTLTVQKANTKENYQEIGGVAQKLTTVEDYDSSRVLQDTVSNNPMTGKTLLLKREISEADIPKLSLKASKQATGDEEDVTDENGTEIGTATESYDNSTTLNPTESITAVNNDTDYTTAYYNETEGTYPTAMYTFNVENISLTMDGPNKCENSTTNSTSTTCNETDTNNATNDNSSTTPGGPYAYAAYNNKHLDNLQLTTDNPNNSLELPEENDRKWEQFRKQIGKNAIENGFKPLAGLYYDSYLHQFLRKFTDWSPNNLKK